MHPSVMTWVAHNARENPGRVLEIGGNDVNGGLRCLFQWSEIRCIDIADGPGVNVVADFVEWAPLEPPAQYDTVLCLETFEHAHRWPLMVEQSRRLLRPAGLFIGTCATDPRPAHDAYGGAGGVPPGQFYRNVPPGELAANLSAHFGRFRIDVLPTGDLRWVGVV